MKKKLLTFLMILTVIFMAVPAAAQAAGEISDGETADLLTQIKQQLSAAFEEMVPREAEMVALWVCCWEARAFSSSPWFMVRSYAFANTARNDATPNSSSR